MELDGKITNQANGTPKAIGYWLYLPLLLFVSLPVCRQSAGAMTNMCVSDEWLKARSAVQNRIEVMVKVASSVELKTLLCF